MYVCVYVCMYVCMYIFLLFFKDFVTLWKDGEFGNLEVTKPGISEHRYL
jgi:hypothetical protein